MSLIKKPFTPQKDQEQRDKEVSKVVPVRFNREELEDLEELGKILRQEQLSTVMKQLMRIGALVIHSPQTAYLIDTLFINEKNNKRKGIVTVNPKFKRL